jgi:hypothetical protein
MQEGMLLNKTGIPELSMFSVTFQPLALLCDAMGWQKK